MKRQTKNLLLVPLLGLFLTSCGLTDGPDSNELVEHYTIMTAYAQGMSQQTLNLLEYNYMMDPQKIKPYYEQAQNVHELAGRFMMDVMTTIDDSIPAAAMNWETLNNQYSTLRDELYNLLPEGRRESVWLPELEYTQVNYLADPVLICASARNMAGIMEMEALKMIYGNIAATDYRWYPLQAKALADGGAGQLSFSLHSNTFQHFETRTIEVAEILKDGKPVETTPEFEPSDRFGIVSIPNPTPGTYVISGEVAGLNNKGLKITRNFSYTIDWPLDPAALGETVNVEVGSMEF